MTTSQRDIDRDTLHVLRAWLAENPYPPTVRELAKALHLSSTAMYFRIMRLVDTGQLSWELSSTGHRRSRTMKVV